MADYQFSRVSISQGLSHNQVNSILQDRQGFIWLGTLSGLNRYDGYGCKVYQHNHQDTTSLINNHITRLFEDPDGRIWVATVGGTSVFDPKTETFFRFTKPICQQYSIPYSVIKDIYRDQTGHYWFITDTAGVYHYTPSTRHASVLKNNPKDPHSLHTNRISALQDDMKGNMWVIHDNGLLELVNKSTYRVIYRNATIFVKNKGRQFIYQLFQDSDRDLWAYSNEGQGVFFFDTAKKTFTQFNTQSPTVKLNNNKIQGITEDTKGNIWIGTDHGGVNLIDKRSFSVRYIIEDPNDDKSLSQNSITTLYKDKEDIIWIGTYKKGVNYYHKNIFKFPFYRRQLGNPVSLPYNDVNCFVEDAKGNLWIGTNGGGLIYFDRQKNTFTQLRHDPNNPASLSNNVVVSLCIDHEQKLWVGTYMGGLDYYTGGSFIHYRHDPNQPGSISDNDVWEILEDSENHLWVGTNGGGLNLFDRERNVFYHYQDHDINSIRSNYVTSLLQDKEGNLWIGTAFGLHLMERQSGRFIHYLNKSNDPESLSNNNITATLEDSRGWIWVGTEEGLCRFDKKTGKFKVFRKEAGLPNNTILGILEDNNHHIWLSTSNGMSNIRIQEKPNSKGYTFIFKNYDERDGLQGNAFNEDVAYRTRAGELIFGGANGFNLFMPEKLSLTDNPPLIALTDLQVFNKSVRIGESINGRVILSQALTETKEITLSHNQNIFAIEFVALNYFHPDKNRYAYILENFDKEWLLTDGKSRKVTYMNLPPGEYIFRVKASSSNEVWDQEGISLKITILPPFWKTRAAYTIYFLLILGALALARILILQRARTNYRIEQERQEALRMHEMDLMKIRFFTNVSHEFKTPLSLIITPLENVMNNPDEGDMKKLVPMVYRNARRLLNLINQLLDFRKMEMQQLKLHPTEGDIIQFIQEATNSFSDISEKKNIELTFTSTISQLNTFFDQDKLEKILFNLLSNAFKFTPGNGSVSVEVSFSEVVPASNPGIPWLQISVKDTGIGIPPEKIERIFERFFQNDISGSIVNQGSGIGLAITKEFVRLHEGTIEVESKPDQGSCFTVRLPIWQGETYTLLTSAQLQQTNQSEVLVIHQGNALKADKKVVDQADKKAVVLLVEDNEDFRFYLKDNLKAQYTIVEAGNGKEGWSQVMSILPDLVVSDVMMPEMDGIELCRKIKNNSRTAHIKIILLTARAADEQKLEGFETGVDDYITKPFNFEILNARIKNLIAQHEADRKAFPKTIEIKPREINILSQDEKLIQKAHELVEKNISNPDYSVVELGRDMGMSRGYLYKKLLSLTGKTPIEFIRIMRLRRAAQLLEQSHLTVSEVAYEVGFNNPKYFAKYFKMEYKLLPSQYIAEKRKVHT